MPQTVQAVWICGCPCLWVLGSFQHLRNIFKTLGVAQWHCLEHWVVICLPEDPLRMCLAPLCPFPGRQEKAGTGGVPGKGLRGDCISLFYLLGNATGWEGN